MPAFYTFYIDAVAQQANPGNSGHNFGLQESREPFLDEAWIDDWPEPAHEKISLAGFEIKAPHLQNLKACFLKLLSKGMGSNVLRRIYGLSKEMSPHQREMG